MSNGIQKMVGVLIFHYSDAEIDRFLADGVIEESGALHPSHDP
jgi:hypothetical protein